ncbi:MAG: hypothetical protein LBT40_15170 [Deltaproteobacteria bacterium]|jgi:hypothetical protein|nr:hypothetical protein [Deltaproteobacteria bacterium]
MEMELVKAEREYRYEIIFNNRTTNGSFLYFMIHPKCSMCFKKLEFMEHLNVVASVLTNVN